MKHKYTRITKEITNAVLKHYSENKSILKASKALGIGMATANRILKRNGIARDGRFNANNKNWAGGITKTRDGYIKVRDPLNVMADCRGYVWEHRLVMAKHIGRSLLRTEVVHHIDDNKGNNHISNLMLFSSQSEHIAHHRSLNDKRTM
jgi:hypothetical protein